MSKRRLSDGAKQPCSVSHAKRLRLNDSSPRPLPSQSRPPSQLPRLTEATLAYLQQSLRGHNTKDCKAVSCLEDMDAPPTPRSGPTYRGRSRRHARSHGSRTPSPNKKPSPQTYRTRNLHHANVRIDALSDLPPAIDAQVRQILGFETWQDRIGSPAEPPFENAAAHYLAESRRNAIECALEGDWKASLYNLIRQLTDHGAWTLKVHMSEKVWDPSLKPTCSTADDIENEDDSGTRTPRSAQIALPVFDPNDATTTVSATGFTAHVPILSPSTVSIAPTTSTEAADPYHLSTPKPDITIGLAHTKFDARHQRRLVDHQASGSILSDPHAADMGIRFPFLVIEAKGLSLNGSLVSAQNQAAVSGACMLAILQDLHNQADGYDDPATGAEGALDNTPALCFSIATAGSIHEMNIHFMHDGCFHMHCFRAFRTTLERDTTEFVYLLHRILDWGKEAYNASIVRKLDRVPGSRMVS
ncbi:hypothetical protein K490DRAFT_47630 [Saccharata proteae CBS 121410]|uniref:DUF7924 domain-containing protein n=1 Tax=Saccharata proteae CBS 121410 TaxID=1314787 RepID=A0A9P4HQX6_9PEZI|nr:hypothetical protein K490DRAFT_47630 [Saccharata proteae CBS 121410]